MTHVRYRLLGLLAAVGLAATTALAPVSAPAQAAYSGTYLHARMSPTSAYPHVYGGARYESHRGWRELEVNLRGLGGQSGKTLTVRVQGHIVGHMRVHSGSAHLYRHRGLPTMTAGNTIRVRTGSGTLVSGGRLHRMHHHGMHHHGMM